MNLNLRHWRFGALSLQCTSHSAPNATKTTTMIHLPLDLQRQKPLGMCSMSNQPVGLSALWKFMANKILSLK